MLTIELKKELFARIKLPELDIEARATMTPQGDVQLSFTPWNQWLLSGPSFEQLVEDCNLLMAHIRLCLENQRREELQSPPVGGESRRRKES